MRAKNLLAIAVFVAIATAACGSSSKNSAGTVTSAPGSSTASTAPNGSAGSGTTTTSKLSGSGSSDFCNLARSDQNAFKGLNATSLSASDLRKQFQSLGPALQHAADVAPSAIKGDFEVFVHAFAPYLKALADANYDFTKINPSSVTGLQLPAVTAASQHIQQYFTQVCHLTPPTT